MSLANINNIEDFNTPEYIWRTHIPTLSIHKVKVKEMYIHKNEDGCSLIVENWKDRSKETRVIISKYNGKFRLLKTLFHLTEEDAIRRIIVHLKHYLNGSYQEHQFAEETVLKWLKTLPDTHPELLV